MLLIIIFLLFLIAGYSRGLTAQIRGIISLLAAFYLSIIGTPYIASFLDQSFGAARIIERLMESGAVAEFWEPQAFLNTLSFILTFVTVLVLFFVITANLRLINQISVVGYIDAFCGAILGAAKGMLVVLIAAGFLIVVPSETWSPAVESSAVIPFLQGFMQQAQQYIQEIMSSVIQNSL
ncbi:MAG: hypothetical protein AVO34_11550 [Firmicutes bacterium ML8_F2]|nr:MAG: hypothetical protein AVO34_11550 [Firmicutes bacterium ML8_F2]